MLLYRQGSLGGYRMEYLIGFILLIIALLILGLILRRKIYDHVDRLEEWKIDIMNRNVTEELSRVKKTKFTRRNTTKIRGMEK